MIRKLGIVFGVVVVAVLAVPLMLYGASQLYPTYTYRYRLAVSVEVDGRTYSGSSVIEVNLRTQPEFAGRAGYSNVVGDAVFLDLGQGRNLVALLAPADVQRSADLPTIIVQEHFGISHGSAGSSFPKLTGSWTLPKHREPALLSFRNIEDPASARLANGSALQTIFGPEARGPVVTITTTTDQPTKTIRQHLTWLDQPGRPSTIALAAAGYRPVVSLDSRSAFERN